MFVVYYNLGLTLAALVPWQEYYSSSTEVQQSLVTVYSNVVRTVVGIASRFGQASGRSAATIDSEVYRMYGGLIESTYARRDQIFDYMWAAAIKSEVGTQGTSFLAVSSDLGIELCCPMTLCAPGIPMPSQVQSSLVFIADKPRNSIHH